MFRFILTQAAVVVITASVMGVFFGWRSAVSAGIGGGICVLPNFLFALHLKFTAHRFATGGAAGFFIGEFVKVALTLGLLAVAIKKYADLHWPSLLVGMVLALQAGLLGLWKKS
jgi:ATP synthase I chain